MADVSRETFNALNLYRKVLFQEGRPVLDAELNELQSILRYLGIAQGAGAIGNFPYGDGLKVIATSPTSGAVNMLPGKFFNYGELVEFLGDPDSPGSPYLIESIQSSGVSTLVNNVYLVWSLTETNSSQNPALMDSTVNIETAIRQEMGTSVSVALASDRLWLPADMEAIFLAKVTRPIGVTVISDDDIQDLRLEYNQNYVVNGFLVTATETDGITLSAGRAIVANIDQVLDVSSLTLARGQFNYIWIDANGMIWRTTAKPGPPATILYIVKTDEVGTITEISNVMKYQPPLLQLLLLLLKDYLSPKRQLYAGDDTLSTATSLTPFTVKTFSIYHDPEVALDVREIGFIINAKAMHQPGKLRIYIDGELKVQHNLPADNTFHIYKSNVQVFYSTPGLHTVELKAWNTTVPAPGTEQGQVRVRLFEGYVKDSSYSRRVNIFGDEGEDTVTSTTMQVVLESSFYSDPAVALDIRRLSYVGQWRAINGSGKVQIFIDGNLYREFTVAQSDSYRIYRGIIDVAWPSSSLHTFSMKMCSSVEGGEIFNRLLEVYADQDAPFSASTRSGRSSLSTSG